MPRCPLPRRSPVLLLLPLLAAAAAAGLPGGALPQPVSVEPLRPWQPLHAQLIALNAETKG
jgi:hypothetical protein